MLKVSESKNQNIILNLTETTKQKTINKIFNIKTCIIATIVVFLTCAINSIFFHETFYTLTSTIMTIWSFYFIISMTLLLSQKMKNEDFEEFIKHKKDYYQINEHDYNNIVLLTFENSLNNNYENDEMIEKINKLLNNNMTFYRYTLFDLIDDLIAVQEDPESIEYDDEITEIIEMLDELYNEAMFIYLCEKDFERII